MAQSPLGPVSGDLPDTAIKVYANNWVATVITSPHPSTDGFYYVYCSTVGATLLDALNAARHVLYVYAWGRTAFIRVEPDAESYTDFDTKIIHHRGITRFSYKLEPGVWSYPSEDIPLQFGEQH
jgi:hypothetical protein